MLINNEIARGEQNVLRQVRLGFSTRAPLSVGNKMFPTDYGVVFLAKHAHWNLEGEEQNVPHRVEYVVFF